MKHASELLLIGLIAVSPVWAQSSDEAEQELLELEHAWTTAVVKRDSAFLKQLYADEYVYTGSDGSVVNKGADISEIVAGKVQLNSFKLDDVKVRVYGDVAVVTGLNILKGNYQAKDVGGPHRFTDVLVKRDGRWQVVASHASLASRLCHVMTAISDVTGRTYKLHRYVPC